MNSVRVSIHRFGDKVAISMLGVDGETVYLSAEQAEQVAKVLGECVESIRSVKFSKSSFGTYCVMPDGSMRE